MAKGKVYLAGAGMGTVSCLTMQARDIINQSDILIGAERILSVCNGLHNARKFVSYIPQDIGKYLRGQDFKTACILLSGDAGFYSGARKLLDELMDFDTELLAGISSVVYFMDKLKMPWEDVCFTSVHGRDNNLVQRIMRNKKTFALLGGYKNLKELCDKLLYYNMADTELYIGERLSYNDEQITRCYPGSLPEKFDNLLVVLAINNNAVDFVYRNIPDSSFTRDKVPMTKAETRALSIAKLGLYNGAVVYDIGAGTGSVSVEIAMQAPDIQVYAIEKNPDAACLIEKNKQKFGADNINIINGTAPEILCGLPAPTHVFIGGSSGSMKQVIEAVFMANKHCSIVINIVTLNSMAVLMDILKEPLYKTEIIQLQVSKNKSAGAYQMMEGQNPVYIVTVKMDC